MKCSGKRQVYRSEIEHLQKASREKKIEDVINQAHKNEQNIDSITQKSHKEYEQCKFQIESFNNKNKKTSQSITHLTEQLEIITKTIVDLNRQIASLQKQHDSHNSRLNDAQQNMRSTSQSLTLLKQQFEKVAKRNDDLHQEMTISLQQQNSHNLRLNDLQQDMQSISKKLDDVIIRHLVKILQWDSSNFLNFVY